MRGGLWGNPYKGYPQYYGMFLIMSGLGSLGIWAVSKGGLASFYLWLGVVPMAVGTIIVVRYLRMKGRL